MPMRSLWITAVLLAGLGDAHAGTPEEEARRCSTILDLAAQNRALDATDVMNTGTVPDAESREADARELETKLADLFERAGTIARREKMPDVAIDGAAALLVMERWVYVSGRANYFGCVRYETADEWVTGVMFGDAAETIADDLRRLARERDGG